MLVITILFKDFFVFIVKIVIYAFDLIFNACKVSLINHILRQLIRIVFHACYRTQLVLRAIFTIIYIQFEIKLCFDLSLLDLFWSNFRNFRNIGIIKSLATCLERCHGAHGGFWSSLYCLNNLQSFFICLSSFFQK